MEAPRRSDEFLLNRAYGCFAFLGLATLPGGVGTLLYVLHWMNFDEGSTGGTLAMLFGMGLATPLATSPTSLYLHGGSSKEGGSTEAWYSLKNKLTLWSWER